MRERKRKMDRLTSCFFTCISVYPDSWYCRSHIFDCLNHYLLLYIRISAICLFLSFVLLTYFFFSLALKHASNDVSFIVFVSHYLLLASTVSYKWPEQSIRRIIWMIAAIFPVFALWIENLPCKFHLSTFEVN